MDTTQATERAKAQAVAQLESIVEMVAALETARAAQDDEAIEEAQQTIQEDPLSIEVRSGWHNVGAPLEAAEYSILLCWGGPAVRIIGQLDNYGEPSSVRLQYQDWFTPWIEYIVVDDAQKAALLAYAREFYYGT
mgnify:CR=1 FL=1